ncbi:MAG: cytochrome C [Desulfuromonas sp.]|nr:MAG: cytochrome C [Desulfuromonas sp.]
MLRMFTLMFALALGGCAMFLTAQAIPPPGGCDQCHTASISSNWEAGLSVAILNDELDRHNWQKPEALLPDPESPLEQQKVTESRCFRCHKSPDELHRGFSGRYHHQ